MPNGRACAKHRTDRYPLGFYRFRHADNASYAGLNRHKTHTGSIIDFTSRCDPFPHDETCGVGQSHELSSPSEGRNRPGALGPGACRQLRSFVVREDEPYAPGSSETGSGPLEVSRQPRRTSHISTSHISLSVWNRSGPESDPDQGCEALVRADCKRIDDEHTVEPPTILHFLRQDCGAAGPACDRPQHCDPKRQPMLLYRIHGVLKGRHVGAHNVEEMEPVVHERLRMSWGQPIPAGGGRKEFRERLERSARSRAWRRGQPDPAPGRAVLRHLDRPHG